MASVRDDITGLRSDIDNRLTGLQNEIENRFITHDANLRTGLADQQSDLMKLMIAQTRTMIFALVTVVVAVASLVLAAR